MSRRNPYRVVSGAPTQTWLPDDAGAYSKGDEIRVEGADLDDEDDIVVVLPDGRRIPAHPVGRGTWVHAFLGEDGWVYLFDHMDDEVKDLLADLTTASTGLPFSVHFPWTERIGQMDSYKVFRQPFYEPAEGEAEAQALALLDYGPRGFAKAGTRLVGARVRQAVPGARGRQLAEAMQYLADFAKRWNPHILWGLEYPDHNVGQDPDGNLVLRDVLYDREQLEDRCRSQLKEQL